MQERVEEDMRIAVEESGMSAAMTSSIRQPNPDFHHQLQIAMKESSRLAADVLKEVMQRTDHRPNRRKI